MIISALHKQIEPNLVYTKKKGVKMAIDPINGQSVLVEFGNEETFTAPLIVGADGGESLVRKSFGLKMRKKEYGQKTVVAVVKSEKSTNNTTFQRFLPLGPIGLLPLHENNNSLVWSTQSTNAERLLKLTNLELTKEINNAFRSDYKTIKNHEKQFGDFYSPQIIDILSNLSKSAFLTLSKSVPKVSELLKDVVDSSEVLFPSPKESDGIPPKIVSIESVRVAFPLFCGHVDSYVKNRVALIGDAAHIIHPMAGQGLNMGIRDAFYLKENIKKTLEVGGDIGSALYLKCYNENVHCENSTKLTAIDLIAKSFSVSNRSFGIFRNFGMALLNNLPPLKKVMLDSASRSVFSEEKN